MTQKRYRMMSESLGMPITVFYGGALGTSVETDDEVQYLPSEVRLLQDAKATIPRQVHLVKKVFDGTLTESTATPPVMCAGKKSFSFGE